MDNLPTSPPPLYTSERLEKIVWIFSNELSFLTLLGLGILAISTFFVVITFLASWKLFIALVSPAFFTYVLGIFSLISVGMTILFFVAWIRRSAYHP